MPIFYITILCITAIISIFAILLPFVLVSNAKSQLRSELAPILLKGETFVKVVEDIKTAQGQLDLKHFEALQTKLSVLRGEMNDKDLKIEALEKSWKNFTQKWGGKIKNMNKIEEIVTEPNEQVTDAKLTPELQEYLEGQGQHIEPETSNGHVFGSGKFGA